MDTYAVTLANNHIYDYGESALDNTLRLLETNDIKYTGAGKDISSAYSALRISKNGISVSLLSICENEFGIAEGSKGGSAGYAPRLLLKTIRAEKSISDYVVVVFHGGNEHNPLPSPDTTERYRLICDMSADAVIGGHTHCPQGYEVYEGKPIIYSMGNFFFRNSNKTDSHDPWYYGYITMLDITEANIAFEIIPYRFDIEGTRVIVFKDNDKTEMCRYIDALSEIIRDPVELKQYFKGWSLNHMWIPQLPNNIYDLTDYRAAENYDLLKCEAHLSQAKQIFEILFDDNAESIKIWQKKSPSCKKCPCEAILQQAILIKRWIPRAAIGLYAAPSANIKVPSRGLLYLYFCKSSLKSSMLAITRRTLFDVAQANANAERILDVRERRHAALIICCKRRLCFPEATS